MNLPLLCLFVLTGAYASAQRSADERGVGSPFDEDARHSVSAQFGIGTLIFLNGESATLTVTTGGMVDSFSSRIRSSPVPTLAYDYRVNRVLSVGGALSRQSIRFGDVVRTGRERPDIDVPTGWRINRTFVSARALLHYGRNTRLAMYSGVRLGLTVWDVKVDGLGEDLGWISRVLPETVGGFVLPHATLIPFALRAAITPRVYVGVETAIGSPQFVAAQVGVRF